METAIDLTGSRTEIDAILALANNHDAVAEVSEPVNLDANQALNAGIAELLVDAKDVLTFITVVFTSGKAAIEFFKVLREDIKQRNQRGRSF